MLYGAHFLDQSSFKKLDQKLRQFGRRLLLWPCAPGAAVLGELGWHPFFVEVQCLVYLEGCLSLLRMESIGAYIAARVFQFCSDPT